MSTPEELADRILTALAGEPRLLVLIGPHAVGKTTVGRPLKQATGWPLDEEIGRFCREQAMAVDPGAHAMRSQTDFDERVIRAELERDRGAPLPRITETWHPGNLAYAALRSPDIFARYEPFVLRGLREVSLPVSVQPLYMRRATALLRFNEPGPRLELVDFFERVANRAVQLASAWGMHVLPSLATDER